MQMILNELSADFPVATIEEGKQVMSDFLAVCKEVRKLIENDTMIMDKDYNLFYLAKDYHISDWRKDHTVDREKQRLFRSILNKAVVYDGRELDDVQIDLTNSEFICNKRSAIGCLIAYETNNFVVSFMTRECWGKQYIKGLYSTLLEEKTIEKPKQVQVLNIGRAKDSEMMKNHFAKQVNEKFVNVRSGKELLERMQEWFPAVKLCENAKEQLLRENAYINIQQIIKKLQELNDYFSSVKGSFEPAALKYCTVESEATLNQYREDHTFQTPDGKSQLFSFHLRFTGTFAGRIFFIPDVLHNCCIVGHIGKKLKNKKFH